MKLIGFYLLLGFLELFFNSSQVMADELSIKQKILMPGPLTEAHAELESNCDNCHVPFTKETMTQRCLDCHDDIAADRANSAGYHGLAAAASQDACETCHTDHEGRDTDITGLIREMFNHANTRFPLQGHHQQLACNDCHNTEKAWHEAETTCNACHEDPHGDALPDQCDQCHQPTQWRALLPFDHNETDFPLTGKHSQAVCSSCHFNQTFQFNDTSCFSCHGKTDPHLGSNGQQCDSCHSTKSWQKITFNHDDTDFPLSGGHRPLPCSACHNPNTPHQQPAKQCQSCHANDDIHLGRFDQQCDQCHNTTKWNTVLFDHQQHTDFPLTGQHKSLSCNQCHAGKLSDKLNRDCAGCHRSDDVHKSQDMALCGTCHSTESWKKTSFFDHDFTHFPLIGMHRIVPCQNCHIGHQFTQVENTCHDCHKQDDIHRSALGENCGQCHTPNAWSVWQFDHNQTEFPLTGQHNGLACDACHKGGATHKTDKSCNSCHRQDDIHSGGFGSECGQCHNTNHFFELQIK